MTPILRCPLMPAVHCAPKIHFVICTNTLFVLISLTGYREQLTRDFGSNCARFATILVTIFGTSQIEDPPLASSDTVTNLCFKKLLKPVDSIGAQTEAMQRMVW